MARYQVRKLETRDFTGLMALEHTLFGNSDDGVLGPYYVRLCCDFLNEACFVVEVEERPVGYLLAFLKGQEVYCTTLAILPAYQGTRAIVHLLRAFTAEVADTVDACWFTVEENNSAARALHEVVGAKELDFRPDFYGPGRGRIVSRVTREDLKRARARLERLGVVERRSSDERRPPRSLLPRPQAQRMASA